MSSQFVTKWNMYHCKDNGAEPSRDCLAFVRDVKAWIEKQAKKTGFSLENFNYNHYDFSGYLKSKSGAYVYFYYDLRSNAYDADGKIVLDLFRSSYEGTGRLSAVLVRTARDASDCSGGMNYFCTLVNLFDLAVELSSAPSRG